jgi:hypothetical protein
MIYSIKEDMKIKEEMKKFLFFGEKHLDIPEDIINEIIILHSLGVNVEDLKYLLAVRLNES